LYLIVIIVIVVVVSNYSAVVGIYIVTCLTVHNMNNLKFVVRVV